MTRVAHAAIPVAARMGALFLLLGIAFGAAAGPQPEVLYRLHCAGCHQFDGTGMPSSGIPPLQDNIGYFLRSEAGRRFLVHVPGTAFAPISDTEVAQLLNWLVPQFSGPSRPEAMEPYTTAEVSRVRRTTPADVIGARNALVNDLRAQGWPVR